ncbi:MAG: hypothetical protein WC717_00195 [Candidatus Micrarchaeia archaeon]|jgi:hypothetical protein
MAGEKLQQYKINQVADYLRQNEAAKGREHIILNYEFGGKSGRRVISRDAGGKIFDYALQKEFASMDDLLRYLGVKKETVSEERVEAGFFIENAGKAQTAAVKARQPAAASTAAKQQPAPAPTEATIKKIAAPPNRQATSTITPIQQSRVQATAKATEAAASAEASKRATASAKQQTEVQKPTAAAETRQKPAVQAETKAQPTTKAATTATAESSQAKQTHGPNPSRTDYSEYYVDAYKGETAIISQDETARYQKPVIPENIRPIPKSEIKVDAEKKVVADYVLSEMKKDPGLAKMPSLGDMAEAFAEEIYARNSMSNGILEVAVNGALSSWAQGICKTIVAQARESIGAVATELGVASLAYCPLGNQTVAKCFMDNPEKATEGFLKIARMAGQRGFQVLSAEEIAAEAFEEYMAGKMAFSAFIVRIISSDAVAPMLGGNLDNYHAPEDKQKRLDFLGSLSDEQVVGLLLSKPDFFYTSSNDLLFGKIEAICHEKKMNVSDYLKKYYGVGLDSELGRNFIFRALQYEKLIKSGSSTGLFELDELDRVLPAVVAPLKENKYEPVYYFLLENCIQNLLERKDTRGFLPYLNEELEIAAKMTSFEAKGKRWAAQKGEAIRGMLDYINRPESFQDAIFARKTYENSEGQLVIAQVFDREDTKDDHWGLTKEWASKYDADGRFEIDKETGGRVYENADTKIILFMGKSARENRQFTKKMLKAEGNAIIVARMHSYSLLENFPPEDFAGVEGNVLFVPVSCASAKSIPLYLGKNPNINIIANSWIGYGQVANYGILDGLIETAVSDTYKNILKRKEGIIKANKGDLESIETPDLLGARIFKNMAEKGL